MVIGVGGLTSDVGKTTLVCDLLRAFTGWEAIKTTRGHYRSCGKDPEACCVSDLLGDEALVRSGRELTYLPHKDTGRYWEAGATNVHWVIGTDAQIESGVKEALARVTGPGVFVEGNSFTKTISPDFFIMVVRHDKVVSKATARQALARASAVFVSGEGGPTEKQEVQAFLARMGKVDANAGVFSQCDFANLVEKIRRLASHIERTSDSAAAS
jgi:molybdopterin-guanine dinucleotide biosynthesis protein